MRKRLIPTARKLRNDMTEAEKLLWQVLRVKSLGVKFRRQAVIGQYIVDFLSYEQSLIIEVDGGQHLGNLNDKVRDNWLKDQGFDILRFWNNDVLQNREGVIERINDYLKPPSLALPTRGREFLDSVIEESLCDYRRDPQQGSSWGEVKKRILSKK